MLLNISKNFDKRSPTTFLHMAVLIERVKRLLSFAFFFQLYRKIFSHISPDQT